MQNTNEPIDHEIAESSPETFRPTRLGGYALEWLLIVLLAYFYCGKLLLNFDATKLQQTGEHNENSTLPILAEIGLERYKEIPLWNPYIMTGLPHAGDFFNHFWNPVSTLPIALFGGINGMKVSVFLTFLIAGLGQWAFAYVSGLRRTFRLWSAVLFMFAGGLALLWRVGWYALLLGIAWFPWCFATLLRALQRQTLPRIAIASLAVFMVLSTGGGYYPVYLFVCLGVLSIAVFLRAKPEERLRLVRTTALVAGLSTVLSAIILVPYLDGYRYLARDAGLDEVQYFSQPIAYGLINYIVHTPDWFRSDILGTASGWNWFYIGWLPLAGLAFVPLAYDRSRRQRWPIILSGVLFLVLMMWFANRYSPIKQVYDWLPILYTFRFPNRLLIVATSPLLILSALGLEYIYRASQAWVRHVKLVYSPQGQKPSILSAHRLVALLWIIALIYSTKAVYDVNKEFGFVDQSLNPKTFTVLKWLKSQDPSLYYVNIGGGVIYWEWTPAAYELEIPVINFQHNRHLISLDRQRAEDSPFIAQAKYQISLADQPHPENAQMLREFDGIFVWYLPDALPYAFSAAPSALQAPDGLTSAQVSGLNVTLRGTNKVVVTGAPQQEGDTLVVLMSNYPGWKLLVDGKLAQLAPVNDYLGARMLPGEHTYAFYFLPTQYLVGASISGIALLGVLVILLASPFRKALHRLRQKSEA